MIWDSFFDDTDKAKDYSIWRKDVSKQDYADVEDPQKVLFKGAMAKFDKENESYKKYFFVLTRNRLYYKKVADG